MKIYTYHEFVPQMPNAHKLLDFWKASWEREGWTAIVLDRGHAEQHPNYSEFFKKYENLPSVNPPGYELACYLRWLAMAVVGGGWMSDSDVIPYGFKPNDYPTDALTTWSRGNGVCPCLVSGTAEHYTHTAKVFADWSGEIDTEKGRPHISDQNILGKVDRFYNNIQLCSHYGETDWDSFPVVHYPNSSMQGKKPREEYIPLLRTID